MTATRRTQTKARLYTAFIELLNEKGFNKITVKELTSRARVNRTTFYNNYTDIYDFEAGVERQIFTTIRELLRADQHHKLAPTSIQAVADYIRENEAVITAMVNGGLEKHMETILKRELVSIMEDFLQADFSTAALLPAKYVRTVFASEISAVFMLWIREGMVESSAELAEILAVICDHPLKEIVCPAHD
ncbi:MAG: TetR/AcrR family transcriptional regulator [Limosilactobacillus gorillae]|jgi:AcrR family transcriptional regulator|uniref:TetR/AcrR family transcriptional regulator n=1 Tax=Limosilactobacillus gorillae TaxID=1450649 RepID=UPI000AF0430F|nr:TetR/AcrR family transcriptional regulator [Limosilactobacillus gorillae]MDO4856219.1 TetR/AcrR family transcriptional regulator [Limosilactobacillus gorillae]